MPTVMLAWSSLSAVSVADGCALRLMRKDLTVSTRCMWISFGVGCVEVGVCCGVVVGDGTAEGLVSIGTASRCACCVAASVVVGGWVGAVGVVGL